MLKANNGPDLDLDEIVAAVKKQYEDMAARSREDVEQWNQKKVRDDIGTVTRGPPSQPAGTDTWQIH